MSPPHMCTGRAGGSLVRARLPPGARRQSYTRPAFAPRPAPDLQHIRQAPGLYEQNCHDRGRGALAQHSWRILALHDRIAGLQHEGARLRQRRNAIGRAVQQAAGERAGLLDEAKDVKQRLAAFAARTKLLADEMGRLALELPNLSSVYTPVGAEPRLIGEIGTKQERRGGGGAAAAKSHVEIGRELDLLDFERAATTSGWGWYFLKNEAALLEQALVQYSFGVALKRGWKVVTPPSLVYSHIASACGYMPRDRNGETQIYEVTGDGDARLVLAGTAEIPLAGSHANQTLNPDDLPIKLIGPSRCYRAEAGARGVDTKGLYRVHEFTKVEMFAWTLPRPDPDHGDRFGAFDHASSQTDVVFDEMLSIQKEILTSLGLHARVLEMPTADLGASASRKIDLEAFFPSRTAINEGYGEVTSASLCTDYQSRRLATRLRARGGGGKLSYPHTLNGTATAVPRLLACLIENHWDEDARVVRVPEVLRRYLPGGMESIGRT